MEDRIRQAISKAIEKLGVGAGEFEVSHPAEEGHGDYATNIALVVGEKPREIAERIKQELENDKELMIVVERIEIAGAGFINFWLKQAWLVGEMERVVELGGDYGRGKWGEKRRVLVDYSSPNIAKDFSVGHLRSTIIGQAIRNLYEFSGWESVGDNHLGDWGTQFGMIIAAVEEAGLDIEKMGVAQMEELYVRFNARAREDEGLRERAKQAFVRLERGDTAARAIWQKSVKASMREFEKVYELLGVKIENAYGESAYEEEMKAVVEEVKEKGLAKESQGALIMELSGLPPGMLLKSDGATTYFTRDLATIRFRQAAEKLKSELYVYEVGAEQTIHFRQLFAAAEKLEWLTKKQLVHVAHGMVLGEDGKKMSTRKGTTIKMYEWLDAVVQKAAGINETSARVVGVGAIKFFDLKHAPETSYKYEWEKALSLDGDTGPYVQYAVVRGESVLGKINHKFQITNFKQNTSYKLQKLTGEERRVLRYLYRFSEVVEAAAKGFAPNLVAEYLLELGKRFNGFYNKQKIIGAETEAFRLQLTQAVVQVLRNGLWILGIEVPERM